jgi:hypothetical protein
VDTQLEGASRLLVGDELVMVGDSKIATVYPKNVMKLFGCQYVELKVRTPLAATNKAAAETGDCTIC